ncbi:hypothetical protein CAEBREN_00870 [Caenorhabditis brenneri]|uniref:Uncharacterized protein n=1 Tax=Caenorhabditis brenneri TaxID=135651 RepID=G0NPJ8_CAEBE|nr:hypothetical protein CAEBREN_00870 [Caenorhabditis brenneri]
MKKLLAILFFAASVMAEPFIKSCEGDNGQNHTNEFLFNHWRKAVMEEIGISNMYELKYDFRLEDEIRKMKSCKDIVHGPNYRVETFHDEKAMAVLGNVAKKSSFTQIKNMPEKFNPLQTFIAYCRLNTNCEGEYMDENNQKETYKIETIYLFGPKTTYDESDFKYGNPGSDCPNGVVTMSNESFLCEHTCGLCKGPEVPIRTTTMIPAKEGAAENSIDDDSAAPFVSIFLIYSIILLVNILNVY